MADLEHVVIQDPDIHEPKDVSTATAGQVYIANGAGSGAWAAPTIAETFEQTSDVVIANTTTEGTLIGAGIGTLVIPANSLIVGQRVKFMTQGIISDTATPTFNLRYKLNNIEIVATGAQTLGAISNDHWIVDVDFVVRSIGATGSIMPVGGFVTSQNDHFALVVLAPVTLDTTIAQTVDITGQWGAASASNTVTSQITELMV